MTSRISVSQPSVNRVEHSKLLEFAESLLPEQFQGKPTEQFSCSGKESFRKLCGYNSRRRKTKHKTKTFLLNSKIKQQPKNN
jgi:hypothetical protein